MNRLLVLVAAIATLVVAFAAPASATRPPAQGAIPEEGHKITICHATRSLSNPYVEIEIDVAAWNASTDPQHHGDHHTRMKDGITWQDYVLGDGEECAIDPPPVRGSCAGTRVDMVFNFSTFRLWDRSDRQSTTFAVDIPAGTYQVVLGSWDDDHGGAGDPYMQPNERWRANFGSFVTRYTVDIGDTEAATFATAKATNVGIYTFAGHTTRLRAEHWSIVHPTPDDAVGLSWRNSVIPSCIGLIPARAAN